MHIQLLHVIITRNRVRVMQFIAYASRVWNIQNCFDQISPTRTFNDDEFCETPDANYLIILNYYRTLLHRIVQDYRSYIAYGLLCVLVYTYTLLMGNIRACEMTIQTI